MNTTDGGNSTINPNPCTSSCSTCGSDPSYCYSCSSGFLQTGDCNPTCLNSFYADADQKECKKCSSNCKTCQTSSTSCSSCRSDLLTNFLDSDKCTVYKPPNADVTCPVDTRLLNKHCCNSSCAECGVGINNCTSCLYSADNSSYLYFHEFTCVKTCPDGFRINFETLSCEPDEPIMALTYASFAYIGVTLISTSSIVVLSKIFTGGKSSVSDSALALLAPID
jgi:hypothetical protein